MLKQLCHSLAKSSLFFYSLLWLMVILITGTIAEHYQGLYYAQKTYFSVYFFYLFGIIPLPGAYTTLGIIFINLCAKLTIDKWSTKKLGTLITHISALLLLLGGFITANFSYEGYIDLAENQSSNYISDYNYLELVIKQQVKATFQQYPNKLYQQSDLKYALFNHEQLTTNNLLENSKINIKINIANYCEHCKLITTGSTTKLEPLPKAKDSEQKHTILSLNLYDIATNKKLNSQIIYVDNDQKDYTNFETDQNIYKIKLRHKRTYLPFKVKLTKFYQELHPGTNIAKSYQSDVAISDSNEQLNWNGNISMNNPLRYKGYTLYQSSYYIADNQYISVFAVVYNVGQNFPYIASIILCIGILLHLLQRVPLLLRKK